MVDYLVTTREVISGLKEVRERTWGSKKVLVIYGMLGGNTNQYMSYGDHWMNAFRALCEDDNVGYYNANVDIYKLPKGYDLYFFVEFNPEFLKVKDLDLGGRTAIYCWDTHLHPFVYLGCLPKVFDYVFVSNPVDALRLEEYSGKGNVHCIPEAFNPSIHHPYLPELEAARMNMVIFIGQRDDVYLGPDLKTKDACTQFVANKLGDKFVRLQGVWGKQYGAHLRASKVGFDFSVGEHLGTRTFEALASGCILLTNERKAIRDFKADNLGDASFADNIVMYRNMDDLKGSIENLLKPKFKAHMDEETWKNFVRNHSYQARTLDMLRIVGGVEESARGTDDSTYRKEIDHRIDAAEILNGRHIGDDPERQTALEEERKVLDRNKIEIFIIIPTLQGNEEYLRLCLESLSKSTEYDGFKYKLLIVGNIENIAYDVLSPSISVINFYLGENSYFTMKVNRAVKWLLDSGSLEKEEGINKYVIFANDDVIARKDAIKNMVDMMQKDENVAGICPVSNCDLGWRCEDLDFALWGSNANNKLILHPDMTIEEIRAIVPVSGDMFNNNIYWRITNANIDFDGSWHMLCDSEDLDNSLFFDGYDLYERVVEWIPFYFVMFPGELVKDTGLLDGQYRITHSDLDYCERAKQKWVSTQGPIEFGICHSAFVFHFGAKARHLLEDKDYDEYHRICEEDIKKYHVAHMGDIPVMDDGGVQPPMVSVGDKKHREAIDKIDVGTQDNEPFIPIGEMPGGDEEVRDKPFTCSHVAYPPKLDLTLLTQGMDDVTSPKISFDSNYWIGRAEKHPRGRVVVYSGLACEDWSRKSMTEKGLGGSETCQIYLCEHLAKLGYEVYNVGQCPMDWHGRIVSGVVWVRYDQWEDFRNLMNNVYIDFFISSRDLDVLKAVAPVGYMKKILWVHDTWYGEMEVPFDLIDKIVLLSPWHKSWWDQCYGDDIKLMQKYGAGWLNYNMVSIISDGVDTRDFPEVDLERKVSKCGEDKPIELAYISSPDRGLDVLIEHIFPELVKMYGHNIYLKVFYGWENFDAVAEYRNDNDMRAFKKKVTDALNSMVAFADGPLRLGKKEFYQELAKCDYWIYPTYFNETFCISAIEAMLCGVTPIVTNLAALRTTVGEHGYLVSPEPGGVYNSVVQDNFINLFEAVRKMDDNRLEKLKKAMGYAKQFDWSNVVKAWDEMLQRMR